MLIRVGNKAYNLVNCNLSGQKLNHIILPTHTIRYRPIKLLRFTHCCEH